MAGRPDGREDRTVRIETATPDVEAETILCLAAAFDADPLMRHFFGDHPAGQSHAVGEFFTLLLRARIKLGMPALVARREGQLVGAAMGYDTAPPEWPMELAAAWSRFEADAPAVADRFVAYETVSARHTPNEPHYYLGVLGTHPQARGAGVGKALVEAFCAQSSRDPRSRGVYLETASEASLAFYRRVGFEVLGQGELDGTRLWCVYRRNEAAGAVA